MHKNSAKFGHEVSEMCEGQTDRQTDTLIAIFRVSPGANNEKL